MRYFLIDKVTELTPGESIRGVKCVTLSDPILHDHFPDYPIMPGALIVEASAQLAGFLVESTFNQEGQTPRRALLMQIRRAKFHDTSGPGDRLEITATLQSQLDSAAEVRFEVRVGEKKIARGELTFVLKEIDSERVHEQRRYLYRLWTRDLTPAPVIV